MTPTEKKQWVMNKVYYVISAKEGLPAVIITPTWNGLKNEYNVINNSQDSDDVLVRKQIFTEAELNQIIETEVKEIWKLHPLDSEGEYLFFQLRRGISDEGSITFIKDDEFVIRGKRYIVDMLFLSVERCTILLLDEEKTHVYPWDIDLFVYELLID